MNTIKEHPISNIKWLQVELLKANDYNPNFVLTPEMNLLKFSLIKQGWIQPILITNDFTIIDGFHRHLLCKNDEEINAMTGGLVPCTVLDITEPERIMLTIRINRAKGVHSAVKMHELVLRLLGKHGLNVKDVMKGVGATSKEVKLLATADVFKGLNIDKHSYSKAWGIEDRNED